MKAITVTVVVTIVPRILGIIIPSWNSVAEIVFFLAVTNFLVHLALLYGKVISPRIPTIPDSML